jgi:hypothetical protein
MMAPAFEQAAASLAAEAILAKLNTEVAQQQLMESVRFRP